MWFPVPVVGLGFRLNIYIFSLEGGLKTRDSVLGFGTSGPVEALELPPGSGKHMRSRVQADKRSFAFATVAPV